MAESNNYCNAGAEHFPSAEEDEQNDEKRSHSGKLSNFIWSWFIILRMTLITKTTSKVIMNSSPKPEK